MTSDEEHAAERELTDYRRTIEGRDPMVRRAWRAGISKHRIFVLSGIARTTIDRILKSKEELVADIHDDGDTYVPDPDACIDGNGQEHPEHDYPPVAEGNECRRCGAEAGDDEEG